jgi:hypothetical protein
MSAMDFFVMTGKRRGKVIFVFLISRILRKDDDEEPVFVEVNCFIVQCLHAESQESLTSYIHTSSIGDDSADAMHSIITLSMD